jgi:hypothetical protein
VGDVLCRIWHIAVLRDDETPSPWAGLILVPRDQGIFNVVPHILFYARCYVMVLRIVLPKLLPINLLGGTVHRTPDNEAKSVHHRELI